ncbi:triple tyrosine motif-containing protein [Flavihumibacter sp. ZG627]|uniref:triple tyrosine motif-containing protein n=1 Tax=Flavihumibacter sp. ZG627 TaxID=1463156 RepID=UPI00057D6E30|nr:triple tyrosine motif-containing protein [Flavihumibacter sp. ZG627]KIC89755.1 hypothetical protein HY58_15440 [Flavihumibacter sp. ZG627]
MKLGLYLLAMILLSFHGMAQNTIGLPQIINYSKTDYHGGTQTWDIRQDSSGVLFFANNEGLITYDGTYWKNFPLPNKTIMRSLALDHQGRVYTGGQGEIGFFQPDKAGFLLYESLLEFIPPAQKNFADIWDIEIVNGSVFFRAMDRIFEWKNNSIQAYPATTEWVLLKKAGSRLFAQDKQNGLFQFRNREWQPLANNDLLRNKNILGIVDISEDSLLLVTLNSGFYLVHGDAISPYNRIGSATIKSDIYAVAQLNEKEFVMGTTSAGCIIMDFQGKIIQQLSQKEGLQNNNVLSVFLDRDKNLWTGLNNGISFIAYNAAIKYIRPNKENELSGFGARIYKNNLYVASSDGAYAAPLFFDQKDLSFNRSDFSFIPNSAGQSWRLDEVNQQLLLAHNAGTFLIKDARAIPIAPEPSWLFVPTSQVVPASNIIVGTYTGLKLLGFYGNNFIDKGNLKGTYESLRFLAIDNNGIIWASHPYRGIYLLELSTDKTAYSARLLTEKDGLPSTLGNHVFKIKNRVVFATEKGAYEYDAKTGKFQPSPLLKPVLGSMELRYLNEDQQGRIWFCSGKKLGVVEFDETDASSKHTITYFPELSGQVLSGFENVYPYDPNNIFIASEKGIVHLNLEKYLQSRKDPGIILGSIRAFGKSDSAIFGGYLPDSAQHLLYEDKNDPMHLPSGYNSLHFEYSSPAFGLQNNIEYSYKLEGFDDEWSAWLPKTEKDYTNLANGKYFFRVKARSNLGVESEAITYTFIIDPPWYKSVWAYLLYLSLLILLVYLINKWQEKKLLLQKRKYEEKQRQINILHQLEIEKNEKEIIKLQNEKLASEMIYKNRELADTTLHLVERTDALTKVKGELQKLYKDSGDTYPIKKTLQLLNDIEKNNENWDKFATHFDEINNDFLKKLKTKYPKLTNTDLKVCAYLQLNLSSKEIAQLMNISVRGVEISRYRLRKKLQIPTEQTLIDFLNNID